MLIFFKTTLSTKNYKKFLFFPCFLFFFIVKNVYNFFNFINIQLSFLQFFRNNILKIFAFFLMVNSNYFVLKFVFFSNGSTFVCIATGGSSTSGQF